MKKILSTILLLCGFMAAGAQTILPAKFKPIEKNGYRGPEDMEYSGGTRFCDEVIDYRTSFYLRPTSGAPSYVLFDIKGEYSKLTFRLGPAIPNPNGDKYNGIITITADGRRILDKVVHDHDAFRYVTLDVTGVHELKFSEPRGDQEIGLTDVTLWKEGEKVVLPQNPLDKLPKGKVELVKQLYPYFTGRNKGFWTIEEGTESIVNGISAGISINRKKFTSGLQITASQGLIENSIGYSYFWLNKRYDKISFIVGPRDNQSANASAWLIIKTDEKTVYEEVITQKDIAKQVVIDVKGVEQIAFMAERRSGDLLGSITFGLVEMYAYPAGDTSVPEEGEVNLNKEKISKLPDVCPLMSSIRPFSVRGVSSADNTMFYGESVHYTFSMGGEKFWEGLVLPTGTTLMDDNIDAYASFDLAGEFDWISFEAGNLTQIRVLDDDLLRVYADDKLILETVIHATWPNQHFELPLNKCRTLRFEKPGTGKHKQTAIGVGDITLYRGKPVPNDLFARIDRELPEEADLIDICERPYFHFVGRYLSSITNFDFNDCFKNGSSQRDPFVMADGSRINKGVMLEANVPLGFEDISLTQVAFMFFCGIAPGISNSDMSAYSGVTTGVSPVGTLSLLLTDASKKQASAAAFNPFGEYESCTFTVGLKSPHVNEFSEVFGGDKANQCKLNVFADQRLVGEYWLDNNLKTFTTTVPIFKCHQLMFWLECGDTRSGQFVISDIKVSKSPCNLGIPASYSSTPSQNSLNMVYPNGSSSSSTSKWNVERLSNDPTIDAFLNGVTSICKAADEFNEGLSDYPLYTQTWVKASNGQAFKCITFDSSDGQHCDMAQVWKEQQDVITKGQEIMKDITQRQAGMVKLAMAVSNLKTYSDIPYFNSLVQEGLKTLDDCYNDISYKTNAAQKKVDLIKSNVEKALDVTGIKSNNKVLIVSPAAGEVPPAIMQRLEEFKF